MELGFDSRRCLIVGGSYGIGLAIARQMAEEGGEVAIASRNGDNLAKAAVEIERSAKRRPRSVVCDVTQSGAADRLMQELGWVGLDALVTAVGGSVRSAFEDLTDEDWIQNYTLNLLSTVRCIRAALPLLRRGKHPAIVMLGAASAKMPYAHQIVSNVHKAGLLALSKTLAGELAGDGIRVNWVGPGRTLTPLWTNRADKMAAERKLTREDVLAEFSKEIPMGRFAEPDEVAVLATWLASPKSSYVTGQAVNADGGIARGLL